MQDKKQTKEKPQNKWLKIIVLVIALVVVVDAALVIVWKNRGSDSKESPAATVVAESAEADAETATEATSAEKEAAVSTDACDISTPVGILTFPGEWMDQVEIEENTDNGLYSASFYSEVNDERVFLFELSVGADGAGFEMGTAPDANGDAQQIWLNISEIQADSSWSAAETDEINTIQSCVNDLIEQVYELDGFQDKQ